MSAIGRWVRAPLLGLDLLPWLGRLLAGRPAECAAAIEQGVVSVNRLESFVRSHRLGPLLHSRLDTTLRESLGRRLVEQWEEDYTRRWLLNERFLQRARFLAQRPPFEAGDWMLLKGPHWAIRFWGDLALREFEDLDVLVEPPLVRPWLQTLVGHQDTFPARVGHRLRVAVTHARSVCVATGDDEILGVDLHWTLRTHPSFRVDQGRLWRTSEEFELKTLGPVTVPSTEYALVLALLEVFDDVSRLEYSLKGLIDVLLIVQEVERAASWPEFLARRREEGLETVSVDVLRSVMKLFGAAGYLPSLRAALAAEERAHDGNATLDALTRRTTRASALRRLRLPLYDTSRGRALLHLAWSSPMRIGLGWAESADARRLRHPGAVPPFRG